jgi:hypothetical protein
MTITPEEYERYLMPVSKKTCVYHYMDFNLRGIPEIRSVTLPMITCLGEGPFMIKRRD